jgi:hypothetical protein
MRLELSSDPHEPAQAVSLGYRTGRHGLIDILKALRADGTHHVTFNLSSKRPVAEVINELADEVLPRFHQEK